jgi:predicted transcriptional regulator
MENKPMSFRISVEQRKALDAIARDEQRSSSSVARILMEIGLEEYRKAKARAGASSNLLQLLDRK